MFAPEYLFVQKNMIMILIRGRTSVQIKRLPFSQPPVTTKPPQFYINIRRRHHERPLSAHTYKTSERQTKPPGTETINNVIYYGIFFKVAVRVRARRSTKKKTKTICLLCCRVVYIITVHSACFADAAQAPIRGEIS